MVRVLICDDQEVVCAGLQAILSTEAGIEVVGVANNGVAALELIPKTRPDVVLMDLKMPVMNGIHATRIIREQHPSIRVLVLTTYDADEWVFDAIRSGASGYLLKDTPRKELVAAIEGTADGKTYVDPAVAGKLLTHAAHYGPPSTPSITEDLSERELDILSLMARGLNNSGIALRLSLSEGTVRNYVSSILAKLDVEDRTQAAILALRHGLVDSNNEKRS